MLAPTLALLLLGAAGGQRGASGLPPEEVPVARTEPRLHAGISVGGLFGVAGYAFTGAAIATAELGVVFNDRFSFVARGEGGSALVSAVGGFSLLAAIHLSDRWSLGVGGKFFGWAPLAAPGSFVGVMMPFRLAFAPWEPRADGAVARRGFVLGLEAAPGISLLAPVVTSSGVLTDTEVAFTASLTVGYAVW
ncbi:MAG: hypothetical protein ACO1OB_33820 [Archangium sp.]